MRQKTESKKGKWIRCDRCGHKLFWLIDGKLPHIEVKCHSCKKIVVLGE